MKEKALVAIKSKLFINPCKQFLKLFKFRFKRPIGLRFRRGRTAHKTHQRKRFRGLLSIFRPSTSKQKEVVVDGDDDQIGEVASMTEARRERLLFPSPITPIYAKMNRESSSQNEVDDACRSFENYLSEMIVNEGKVRDLNDVEELLYCWKNLKSPVFIDLVCRFYGELCKDLFSSRKEEEDSNS